MGSHQRIGIWHYLLETASAESLAALYHKIRGPRGGGFTGDHSTELTDIERIVLWRHMVAEQRAREGRTPEDRGIADRFNAEVHRLAPGYEESSVVYLHRHPDYPWQTMYRRIA